MTHVKICGLRVGDDVTFVRHAAVSHVGIIFVEASKRFVPPALAATITKAVRRESGTCSVMGVFVNQSVEHIRETLRIAGASGAQLHGQESPEDCRRLRAEGYPVWKSISVMRRASNDTGMDEVIQNAMPFLSEVDGILLDAAPPSKHKEGVTGGYGHAFDWDVLPDVLSTLRQASDTPVWVAGGITPENVRQLLQICDPDGIDVSSGVEQDGQKRLERIEDLLEAVANVG